MNENEKVNNEAANESAQDEAAAYESVIQKFEEKLKEAEDKHLRLLAEFDNYKKRTQKEKVAIYTDATADAITAILPIADNIMRAIEMTEGIEADAKTREGLQLIQKQLDETFNNLGIKPIEAVGKEFDPNLHNAVAHIENDDDDDKSIIVEEYSKGYILGEKVIRHSVVKVAN